MKLVPLGKTSRDMHVLTTDRHRDEEKNKRRQSFFNAHVVSEAHADGISATDQAKDTSLIRLPVSVDVNRHIHSLTGQSTQQRHHTPDLPEDSSYTQPEAHTAKSRCQQRPCTNWN